MIFDGRNGGVVELLDNSLVIRRKGVLSALNQGLKGEKRIPYSSITSVQFKEVGFTTGYIQFGVLGGRESRAGVWDAVKDENTVLFTKEASNDFRRLRDLVEERIRGGPAAQSSTPQISVTEELTRLADLRDRGVLTDEEFQEQKRRLLDATPATHPTAPRTGTGKPAAGPIEPTRKPAGPGTPGKEPLNGKKLGAGKVAGYGCLGLVGFLFLLGVLGSTADKKNAVTNDAEETEALTTSNTVGLFNDEKKPAEEPSSWSYSQDEDKVRGGTTFYATTTSTNSIAQDFPYESDTRMTMTVRKSKAYGTDVILQISSGQMMCPSYEGCSGTVRFDNGPAQRISFNGPADNSSDTVFVVGAKSFIGKLKNAKKVTVEKTLYEAGNPQFEFDVSGLRWDH